MAERPSSEREIEERWRAYLTRGEDPAGAKMPWYLDPKLRPLIRQIPTSPRCKLCYYPFEGVGGAVARHLLRIEPSRLNPHVCNVCERYAAENQGGAEVETTVLFADVRGSTALAEGMPSAEFGRLISRFYAAVSKALIDHSAMIEKLIGDEVTGFFVPGIAGPGHARAAVDAAGDILRATGHGARGGPWVPVGVGVHTGLAYVGAVTVENGAADIVVLGDTANTGARLASAAGPGEILVSDAVREAAGLDTHGWERRVLELKGRSEPVTAWALQARAGPDG